MRTPAKRRSSVPSASACKAEKVVLAIRAAGVVGIGAARHAKLVGVVSLGVLHREPVLQCLAGKAARDVIHPAHVGREAEDRLIHLVAGKLVVRRQQRMRLGLPFSLLDLDQPLVAHARLGPGGVDRPASGVIDVQRVHPAVAHIGIVRDGEEFNARIALGVHPLPELRGFIGVERAERRRSGTLSPRKKTLRCRLRLPGIEVHS